MDNKNIIIEDNLQRLGSEELRHRIAHVLCEAGSYVFQYNGENFVLEAGQTMIIPYQQFYRGCCALTLLASYLYLPHPEYAEYCSPRSNYGIRGALALFANPNYASHRKAIYPIAIRFSANIKRPTDRYHSRFSRGSS